jgi:hypothetical protein
VAYRDEDITLYTVGGDQAPASGRAILLVAHLVWLAVLLAGLGGMVVALRRRTLKRPA